MFDLRDQMYQFVMKQHAEAAKAGNHVPLVINPNSAAYKNFAK